MLGTEKSRRGDEVSDLLDTVKAYAKQETVGPLKGVGRAVGLGLAAVLCLAVGTVVLLVAVLRFLQTEVSAFDGDWSFVPYLIDLVLAAIVIALALSRIKKVDITRGEPRS